MSNLSMPGRFAGRFLFPLCSSTILKGPDKSLRRQVVFNSTHGPSFLVFVAFREYPLFVPFSCTTRKQKELPFRHEDPCIRSSISSLSNLVRFPQS